MTKADLLEKIRIFLFSTSDEDKDFKLIWFEEMVESLIQKGPENSEQIRIRLENRNKIDKIDRQIRKLREQKNVLLGKSED